MNFQAIAIYLLLAIILSGCSPILKVVYGYKNPTPTSDQEAVENSKKLLPDYSTMYRPVNDTAYAKLVNEFEIGFPTIMFFNTAGKAVSMNKDETDQCTANADALINSLGTIDELQERTFTQSDVTQLIRKIRPVEDAESPNTEQNTRGIIIFWADFAGKKLNRTKTKKWVNTYLELNEATRQKTPLKIVNMDFLPLMQ